MREREGLVTRLERKRGRSEGMEAERGFSSSMTRRVSGRAWLVIRVHVQGAGTSVSLVRGGGCGDGLLLTSRVSRRAV